MTLTFRRIQFTPDLMPADIVGTNMVIEDPDTGRRRFQFQPGPIFDQCILADEVNRATPKTQSALLEAMQEHSVTVGGTTYALPEPFIVLATQNPIEQEGTYPLPEAQLDRFMFKVLVPYSNRAELASILDRTTAGHNPTAEAVIDGEKILEAQRPVQRVVVAPHVQDYAIRLVLATHPGGEFAGETTNKFVRYGASPRGVQGIMLGAKVRAMLDGRYHLSFDDVAAAFLPALRHRILLNFEGQAEGIDNDTLLAEILAQVPRPRRKAKSGVMSEAQPKSRPLKLVRPPGPASSWPGWTGSMSSAARFSAGGCAASGGRSGAARASSSPIIGNMSMATTSASSTGTSTAGSTSSSSSSSWRSRT